MKQIFNFHALRNGEAIEYLDLLLAKSDPGSASVPGGYDVIRAQVRTVAGLLREAYARDPRSEQTDIIVQEDGNRDDCLAALFGIIGHFRSHPENAAIRDAAKKVFQKLSAHGTAGEIGKDDILTESATVEKIVTELRGRDMAPLVGLLPVEPWINALERSNSAVRQAFQLRGDERAPEQAGELKRLRQQASKAQYALVRRIGLYGEDAEWAEPWRSVNERVNELRTDFRNRLAQRAGIAAAEAEPGA
ncbi:hypothetical protein EPD60_13425 [Flaviaesturariibacter flavus]|uniref:Uncharacterized protein n=1 Tax=Flaviaesturariibacter flavus TaxID=2502780 RepID=A0A4R1B993_9BACT|nr:DUF6261 family protein [Flaviaesturariibacter flavus]TCJ13383.1 hypothetical protein EPD60_13425 [Flaviaesturariibacter flavus]